MGADALENWSPPQRSRLEAWDVERSVDVHCHCLPGLDDGPETIAESLELCRALAADGVTTVFATPHQLGRYDGVNTAARIREALAELQAEIVAANIPLELIIGADVRIDERLLKLVEKGEALTAGSLGKHLLLELPHDLYVDPLPAIVALGERGVQTIMTHPERHRYLAGSTRRLEGWVAAGAALQITAGSLIGEFGRTAEHEAWRIVEDGMVSLVASDAHEAVNRPPRMTAAVDILTERLGRKFAGAVCVRNPLKVFMGEKVKAVRP